MRPGNTDAVAPSTGAGESGKSTVLKQMKLIYSQGFSKNERLEWKPVVFSNIVQSFKVIFEAMGDQDIAFENPDNEVCLEFSLSLSFLLRSRLEHSSH